MDHSPSHLRRPAALLIFAGAVLTPTWSATAAGWHATPFTASPRITHPLLAFYYSWYHRNTWCRCRMSDLPAALYDSSDVPTIDRQIRQAAQAGITGFITSWPGPNSTQDTNLGEILARADVYQRQTHIHFVTSV